MNSIEAILLGALQGLTEFLPISSSGHLVVVETILKYKASDYLFFDLLLHVATLVAVCFFFRQRLFQLIVVCLDWMSRKHLSEKAKGDLKLVFALLLSTVITGAIGIKYEDELVSIRNRMDLVGIAFLITGALLISTRFARQKTSEPERAVPINLWLYATIMGLVQAAAITPGISRSGSTICVALLLGVSRAVAIEYSFLMSIPAILGACVLEWGDLKINIGFLPASLGFIVSLISGLIFLGLLVRLVNSGRFYQFAFYLIPFGLWVLWYSF